MDLRFWVTSRHCLQEIGSLKSVLVVVHVDEIVEDSLKVEATGWEDS